MTAELLRRARAMKDLRRFDDAIPLLHQVLAQDPQNYDALCLLGFCLWNLDRNKEALGFARQALAANPSGDWGHRLHAGILMRLGKKKQALAAAREAMRITPYTIESQSLLVEVLVDNRKYKEAKELAERMREQNPDVGDSHHVLGMVALGKHRWKEAEAHFRKALELEPGNWVYVNNLALAIQHQWGRKKEAVELFGMAARTDPRAKEARENVVSSSRGYVWGGLFLILYILARTGLLILLPFALAIFGFVAWRRYNEMPEQVRQVFRYTTRAGVRRKIALFLLIGGLMGTGLWVMFWITDATAFAPRGGSYLIFLALIAAAGAGTWMLRQQRSRL